MTRIELLQALEELRQCRLAAALADPKAPAMTDAAAARFGRLVERDNRADAEQQLRKLWMIDIRTAL